MAEHSEAGGKPHEKGPDDLATWLPDFRGVYIPREILFHPDLSPNEKLLMAMIDAMDKRTVNGGVRAGNKHFGKIFGLKSGRIKQMVSHLGALGMISVQVTEGTKRIIRSNLAYGVAAPQDLRPWEIPISQDQDELPNTMPKNASGANGLTGQKMIPTPNPTTEDHFLPGRGQKNDPLHKDEINSKTTNTTPLTPLPPQTGEATTPGTGGIPRADASPELIYEAYPRKVERPVALDRIKKALDRLRKAGMDRPGDYLLGRTKLYAQARRDAIMAGDDPSYTPYPQKWFGRERYLEDETEWTEAGPPGGPVRPGPRRRESESGHAGYAPPHAPPNGNHQIDSPGSGNGDYGRGGAAPARSVTYGAGSGYRTGQPGQPGGAGGNASGHRPG